MKTEKQILEADLNECKLYLSQIEQISQLGTYIFDIVNNTWKSSTFLDTLFGIESNHDKSFEGWTSIIHPDWQEEMNNYVVNDVIGNNSKFDKEYLIVRKSDKQERWVHGMGELFYNENQEPIKLIGTIQDITDRKKTDEALQLSEKFLKETQALASIGNWSVNFKTNLWTSSEILDEILGLNSDSKIEITDIYNLIHPEWKNFLVEYFYKVTAKHEIFDVKFKIIRQNDKVERWVHVIGELKTCELNLPVFMIGTMQDITKRKEAKEELRQSKEELKNFASHLQNVREEERILLAREIHDELGQILIALKIDLGLLKQSVIKSIKKVDAEEILTNFDNVFGMVDKTIKTTRKIMTDLRPEVLYLVGFVEAAKLYINDFKERFDIYCYFEYTTAKLELNTQQSVVLYRIIQESLTNVARHSKATKVHVILDLKDGKLTLEISDNGVGFNADLQTKKESFGIIGMKERVYILDGELQINSKVNAGTSIKVLMPYLYK